MNFSPNKTPIEYNSIECNSIEIIKGGAFGGT